MTTNFLVINQHGDNRGDEAALRGMVAALRDRVPGARFTVLHQFSAPASAIELTDVDYLPLRVPVHEAIRLSFWAAMRRVGIRADVVLGDFGRKIVAAYEQADLVISAPGGPYFGDLYANHEVVHWFYTWMATLHRTPLFLYQPSAGPFRNRIMNPVRRRGFRWFDELTVREAISADYLEAFTGRRPHVGSDSALQEQVPAIDPTPWTSPTSSDGATSALVTGTFRDPGPEHRAAHDAAVVDLLVRVSETGRNVVLLPQLHGPRHRDEPYLESLAERGRARGARVQVAPETLSSNEQRGLVAASDLVLAGRYHPLVFAVSAGIPALVIPYEHKARGFAGAAGLADYVVELGDLHSGALIDRLDDLIEHLQGARDQVRHRAPELRQAALATSDRVIELLDHQNARN